MLDSTSYTAKTVKLGEKLWSDKDFVFTKLPPELIGKTYLQGKFRTKIEMTALQDGYLYVLTPPSSHRYFPKNILEEGSGFTQLDIASDWCLSNYVNPVDTLVYERAVTAGENITIDASWAIVVEFWEQLNLEPMIVPNNSATTQNLDIGQKIWSDSAYTFISLPEALIGQQYLYGSIDDTVDVTAGKDGYFYVITPSVLSADVPAVCVIVNDQICAVPVTVTDETGKDLTDYTPTDISGFTTQKAPVITGAIKQSTVDAVVTPFKKKRPTAQPALLYF